MKLIGTPTSPYVRKVRIVLAEKKIDYDWIVETPWQPGSTLSSLNPLGKIPILQFDDGATLFDSRVIVDYLDAVAPNNRLIPTTNRDRIQVKRWEALADGVCDAASSALLEGRRPDGERSDSWITRQRGKVATAVAAMSADLGDHTWCHGNGMTLADVAVGCALGYLNFRFPDIEWRPAYPNLARLADKLAQRPSFADTGPKEKAAGSVRPRGGVS
ncbi:MAG TPA: glutathione S-transferase, partial [Rhodocyclaceae bacterium]|nr:glutathione S-transferase [Rhodocyclaceae bacterium]